MLRTRRCRRNGAWIGRIGKTYDYINRVVITLPLSVYEGTWTHSPLSLLCITMILCVRRNFFEITTFPNMGSPDLPACGLRRGSRSGPVWPVYINPRSRPSRGASLVGRTTQGFLRGGLTRQAREEAERSRQGVPREVLVTQAMTIKTRRAPARAVSSFPLWCKGGKRRCGLPRHQAKVSISVQ